MADEVVGSVDARSPVSAGIGTAVVDVGFTVGTVKAWRTLTGVAVDSIGAHPSILTRVRLAFNQVVFTGSAVKARRTRAREAVDFIRTLAAMTWR